MGVERDIAEKYVERDMQGAKKIFDNRSLKVDYRTLIDVLEEGMNVLDVGCGTGAISKDIASVVGDRGKVVAIDNCKEIINIGRESYGTISNLRLIHSDIFDFNTKDTFDLVISARTLQWLSKPKKALLKMKSFLKQNGKISILDYNHNAIEWNPLPPESMQCFYALFLKWRKEAGMSNQITEELPSLFEEIGLKNIQKINSDEHYHRSRSDFMSKVGIWSKVAESKQMEKEGYIDNELRMKAIEEYDFWVKNKAVSMVMKLNEVRGKV